MSVTNQEFSQSVNTLREGYSDKVLKLVTMHHFASNLMVGFAKQNGVSLAPQISTLDQIVAAFMASNDISNAEFLAAQKALSNAAQTLEIVDSLPEA